jgi:hypothetical protein
MDEIRTTKVDTNEVLRRLHEIQDQLESLNPRKPSRFDRFIYDHPRVVYILSGIAAFLSMIGIIEAFHALGWF